MQRFTVTPTWDGKCGNRVKPGVFGPCPRWTLHTCHSRAPAPRHIAGTLPPALGAPPAAPGFDKSPHSDSVPSAYTASRTFQKKTVSVTWRLFVCNVISVCMIYTTCANYFLHLFIWFISFNIYKKLSEFPTLKIWMSKSSLQSYMTKKTNGIFA